ncbi:MULTISPECIES: fluoride efflux transporter FluC [Bacillaceae]|uniref:fluoride efflux transporter FluC n=1 Tax=Bacillaceae TaxID=186817 RepID=UPI001188AA47|nr:CrcB family protein [Bacillus sp. S3]QCJ43100.1 CrcB family protein [Bacillus sp. S3]
MSDILLVSAGGFIGAISRFAVSQQVQKRYKTGFPVGTLTVNFIGSFLLGLLIGMQIKGGIYSLFGIGFMGAFTTFSTMMLEAEQLKSAKKNKLFNSYIIYSYLIGIVLAFCGIMIGKMIK